MAIRETKSQLEKRIDELMNSSGGGTQHGVGEWLDADHTIERFNLYEDIDQWDTANSSTMLYDHIEGYSNHMTGSGEGYNHLEGKSNTGSGCNGCSIGGTYNQAYNCYASDIEGSNNNVRGAQYSHISGYNNTIGDANTSGGAGLDISGGYHTVKNSSRVTMNGQRNSAINCQDVTVFGQNNSATKLSYGFIAGQYNSAQNSFSAQADIDYAFIFGSGCSAGHSNSFVCGENGTDANGAIFAVGGGNGGNNFEVKSGGSGHVYARGYDTYGADYAEYFEWSDGNPEDDDRMGLLVEFVGDKIVPAQGFDFIGAISARASVIGNAYENYWHKKYVTDVFGRMMFDDDGKPLINPEFDENQVYIPRSQRPEWDVTGLVGRIIVCDNGHCEPGCHVSARRGIACPTFSVTRGLCLKRVDDNHIEILIK